MNDRAEIVDLVKPVEDVYRPQRQYSRRDIVRAAFGSPAALVTYAVPVAFLSVALTVVTVATTPSNHVVYANNALQFIDLPAGRLLALIAPLALLSIVVLSFASAATQLIITARLISRPVRVLDAWRHSARILRRLLPPAAVLAVVIGLELVACVGSVLVGVPAWVAIGALGVMLATSYPLVYLFSLTVLRPMPARTAWREMRALGRTINAAGMLARVPVALPLLLGIGINVGLRFLQASTGVTLLNTTAFGLATTVVAMFASVGVVAAVSRLTLEGLSRQDEPQHVELPRATRPSRTRTTLQWAGLVVAVVLPFGFAAGAVGVNPTNITTTTVAEIGDVAPNAQTIDAGSGVLITSSEEYSSVSLAVCESAICSSEDDVSLYGYGKSMAPASPAQVIFARWVVDEPKNDIETWSLQVTHLSPADLQFSSSEDRQRLEPANLTTIDTLTVVDVKGSAFDAEQAIDLAIDTSGETPVIASLSAIGSEHNTEDVVSVYRCADAECSSASKQSIALMADNWKLNVSTLDLAVRDDGTAFITVMNYQEELGSHQDDTVLIVAPPTGEPTLTKVIDGSEIEYDFSHDDDDFFGTQLALNGDGQPVMLYRLYKAGSFQLLVCADEQCAESTTRSVPGLTSAGYFPALTVDDTGRPLIATYSTDEKSVIVLSCTDTNCANFETRVVAAASQYTPSALSISIDSAGLPIVTIADNFIYDHRVALGDPARVVHCQQPRCGAQ